ncbi:hypothetical protein GK047_15410 [Paenibacillus sp. SYP-B3998]|uniref:Uncharacterized protein n=1 Tax=Paenibacillus sp. SYP-B3998 TaxID=2678564 RepID=A0A6G4A0P1_9BACL|nr:hypothetical protein [Paenibacillus sp. SYP-B3998]NEW07391.1 hypothetical protein [Paenibacillus sp. SYP-B3998]
MRSLLKLGGYCNLVISLLHIAGLFWAKEMFRVTGVSEPMGQLSALHSSLPYLLTAFVAIIFALFGIYAIYAEDERIKLPFKQNVIYGIAIIYFLRGFGEWIAHAALHSVNATETLYSSIAIAIGAMYGLGGWYLFKKTKTIHQTKEIRR